MFVAAAVLLGAFVLTQTASRIRCCRCGSCSTATGPERTSRCSCRRSACSRAFLFLTYYLQVSLHYSAVMTGTAFLPMTGTLVVVAGVASTVLVTRVSPRVLVPAGLVISSVAMYLLTSIGIDTAYVSHVLPALILLGVGLGLVFAPAFNLGTLGVRAEDSGVASATINVVQQVGGAVGTALLNTIASAAAVAYAGSHLSQPPTLLQANAAVHSYTTAFWWAAGIFLLAAVLTAALLRSGVAQAERCSRECSRALKSRRTEARP